MGVSVLHRLLSLCHLNTADVGCAEPEEGTAPVCVLPGWHAAGSCASCLVARRAAQRTGQEAPHGAPEPRHAAAGASLAWLLLPQDTFQVQVQEGAPGLGDAYDSYITSQ